MEILIQIVGWLGAFMVILAFYLISHDKISSKNVFYHLLNLCGAVLVGVNAFYMNALPSLGIQILWAGVSVLAILNLNRSRI